jgi:hypothetical protein
MNRQTDRGEKGDGLADVEGHGEGECLLLQGEDLKSWKKIG